MNDLAELIVQLLEALKAWGVPTDFFLSLMQSPYLQTLLLVATVMLFLFKFFKMTALDGLSYLARLFGSPFLNLISGKRVIIFSDADEGVEAAATIGIRLKNKLAERLRIRPVYISSGDKLLGFPLAPLFTRAVILLNSDVSPLSADPAKRVAIQQRLKRYVEAGGLLIGSHDIIYRRTKNYLLQDLFGCRITSFHMFPGATEYKLNPDSRFVKRHGEVAWAPSLDLLDGEVVTGDWAPEVDVLYSWANKPDDCWPGRASVPLVTRKAVGGGAACWINSGDTGPNGGPASIRNPQPELISLLGELLEAHASHRPGGTA